MFLLPEGAASETGTPQSTEPGLPGLRGERGPKGHAGLKGMKGDLCLLRFLCSPNSLEKAPWEGANQQPWEYEQEQPWILM